MLELNKARAAYRRYKSNRLARQERNQYLTTGRLPWSTGYRDYRDEFIQNAINSSSILDAFRNRLPLEGGFGANLDERVVEYPWVISRLTPEPLYHLDAGSTLNQDFILNHPNLAQKTIVIYNLSPEATIPAANISYIYGDLRDTILKSELFDIITCLSVLEHIGMDNTRIYSTQTKYKENAALDYQRTLNEFWRLLKPSGRLLLTVPYGRYENHGWLQQFDAEMITGIEHTFQPVKFSANYYKYSASGWNISTPEACADCSYYDVHENPSFQSDYAAAARAVACLELIK